MRGVASRAAIQYFPDKRGQPKLFNRRPMFLAKSGGRERNDQGAIALYNIPM